MLKMNESYQIVNFKDNSVLLSQVALLSITSITQLSIILIVYFISVDN